MDYDLWKMGYYDKKGPYEEQLPDGFDTWEEYNEWKKYASEDVSSYETSFDGD